MTQIRPNTQTAIIEAAFQVLGKRPGASLTDISEHAGVGRATLHRHFRSREELMIALFRTAMEELDEAIDAAVVDATSHTDGLKRVLGAIIPLAERQWFLTQEPAPKDATLEAAYKSDQAALSASIDQAKSEGTFDPAVPTHWIAETFNGLVFAAWAHVRAGELTPKQATELAWRTLLSGVAADT